MNELELFKEQAQAQIKIIDGMKQLDARQDKADERLDYLERTLPLNRGEAFEVKFKIREKTEEFAIQYFGKYVSKELFGKKKVHFSKAIHYLLNRRFNTVSYTTLLHVDFEKAIEYIKTLNLDNLPPHYKRLTDKQYEISLKNNDGLPEDFKGAHQRTLELV